jgi:hypothetical protein
MLIGLFRRFRPALRQTQVHNTCRSPLFMPVSEAEHTIRLICDRLHPKSWVGDLPFGGQAMARAVKRANRRRPTLFVRLTDSITRPCVKVTHSTHNYAEMAAVRSVK